MILEVFDWQQFLALKVDIFIKNHAIIFKVIWFGFKISNLVILMNKYQRPQKFFNEFFLKTLWVKKLLPLTFHFKPYLLREWKLLVTSNVLDL